MQKPEPHPFDESNIALLGSDIDHHLRAESADKDPAFHLSGIGTSGGTWIWRVEDFKLVPWPKARWAQFFEGDSYLVLHSEKVGEKDGENQLVHRIHFWLGDKTSQDEAGVAAYKSVELDELLGGGPTEYREVQSSESPEFLSLFKPANFTVLRGGHSSGFNHVTPMSADAAIKLDLPRLFTVVASTVREIPLPTTEEGSMTPLSHAQVFILDTGDSLIQFNGRTSRPLEKAKAAEIVRHWADAREGRAEVTVVEDNGVGGDVPFWKAMGADISKVQLVDQPRKEIQPLGKHGDYKLFNLNPSDGSPEPVSLSGPIRMSLVSDGVYLLVPAHESRSHPIYIWMGQALIPENKKLAMSAAQKAVTKIENHGGRRGIVKVKEGREGEKFWKDIGED